MDRIPHFKCDLCGEGLDSRRQGFKHFDQAHGGQGTMSVTAPPIIQNFDCVPEPEGGGDINEEIKDEEELIYSLEEVYNVPDVSFITSDPLSLENEDDDDGSTVHSMVSSIEILPPEKIQLSKISEDSPDSKKFICSVCEDVFTSDKVLRDHLSRVHGIKKSTWKCTIGCGKVFEKRLKEYHHRKKCPRMQKIQQSFGNIASVITSKDEKSKKDNPNPKQNETKPLSSSSSQNKPDLTIDNMFDHCSFNWKTRTYNCKICKKQCPRKFSFEQHFEKQHLQIRHKCEHCPEKSFCTARLLRDHMKSTHPELETTPNPEPKYIKQSEDEYKCISCEKVFSTARQANSHYFMTHHMHKTCILCNNVFKNKRSFDSHDCFTNGSKKFSCNMCKRKFLTMVSLNTHKMFYHGSEDVSRIIDKTKKEKCSTQKKSKIDEVKKKPGPPAPPSAVSKLHSKKPDDNWTYDEVNKRYICKACKASFARKFAFELHFENIHLQIRYKCDKCPGWMFNSKTGLQKHMNNKHPKVYQNSSSHLNQQCSVEEKYRRCILCGKDFKEIDSLRKHFNQIHMKTCELSCDVCAKMYPGKLALSNHRNRSHSGVKFTCADTCGKQFITRSSLNRHQKECLFYLEYLSDLEDCSDSDDEVGDADENVKSN